MSSGFNFLVQFQMNELPFIDIDVLNDEATGIIKQLTYKSFLSASACNAQGEMPLPMLVLRLIDTAVAHANALGIGYSRLIQDNAGWVLSRVSIEMDSFPKINSEFSITTWVEGINRHFSLRNFAIADAEGNTIGYARTVWVAIDMTYRRPADLTPYLPGVVKNERECPIVPAPRLAPLGDDALTIPANFTYADLDFNRHINTTRYVEKIISLKPLDFYDKNRIARFDITFHHETTLDDDAQLLISDSQSDATSPQIIFDVEFTHNSTPAARARIIALPR